MLIKDYHILDRGELPKEFICAIYTDIEPKEGDVYTSDEEFMHDCFSVKILEDFNVRGFKARILLGANVDIWEILNKLTIYRYND